MEVGDKQTRQRKWNRSSNNMEHGMGLYYGKLCIINMFKGEELYRAQNCNFIFKENPFWYSL